MCNNFNRLIDSSLIQKLLVMCLSLNKNDVNVMDIFLSDNMNETVTLIHTVGHYENDMRCFI